MSSCVPQELIPTARPDLQRDEKNVDRYRIQLTTIDTEEAPEFAAWKVCKIVFSAPIGSGKKLAFFLRKWHFDGRLQCRAVWILFRGTRWSILCRT